MIPYGRQSVSTADIAAVTDVMQGDWLTTGPTVSRFEAAISQVTGGHHVVSCTSGTAALHIAYSAVGLEPGDEVITTPMTFIATASGASLAGASVVFADIEAETANLDPAAVRALLTNRTRVIAAVDFAGHPADWDSLTAIARQVGALTLDDAAHSIGASYKGTPVGDLADITTFSFFPTKNITTSEGGAVVARAPVLADRAREFHNIGLVRDPGRFQDREQGPWHQEVHEFGLNYRLSDLACALGLSQLARLRQFKTRRSQIVSRYNEAFAGLDGVQTPVERADVDPTWHLYPIRILDGRRREVFEAMRKVGIGVQVNYLPVYWHPVYKRMGYRRGMCPNAESFYEEELSLPLFPDLSQQDVEFVIEALHKAIS